MINLSPTIKQFYIENPEGLAQREFQSLETLEDLIKKFRLEVHTPEIVADFNQLWKLSKSYWIFPEEKDYMKIIDKVYAKYQNVLPK